jgi:hypothetical protein
LRAGTILRVGVRHSEYSVNGSPSSFARVTVDDCPQCGVRRCYCRCFNDRDDSTEEPPKPSPRPSAVDIRVKQLDKQFETTATFPARLVQDGICHPKGDNGRFRERYGGPAMGRGCHTLVRISSVHIPATGDTPGRRRHSALQKFWTRMPPRFPICFQEPQYSDSLSIGTFR